MRITDYLSKDDILIYLKGTTKNEIIKEMIDFVAKHHSDVNAKEALGKVLEREALETTGIGCGVAIPHARLDQLENVRVVFALHQEGADFKALDGIFAKIFCLVLYPADQIGLQIRFLARLSRLFHVEDLRNKLSQAKTNEEVFQTIKYFEDEHFH